MREFRIFLVKYFRIEKDNNNILMEKTKPLETGLNKTKVKKKT